MVTGGKLHVAQRDAGVEGGHDERGAQHVRVDVVEPGPFADRPHPAVGGAGVEPGAVGASQDRPTGTLADHQVERAGSARHERDGRGPVAFADDAEGAMAPLEPEVFDVGAAGFAHAQPVQAQQHRQPGVTRCDPFGGVQEGGELTPVHPPLRRWVNAWSTHVLGRVGADAPVDVGEAVVAANRRQSPINRRRGQSPRLHRGPVQLDVGPGGGERWEADVAGPLEELAQIGTVGLQGAGAIAGQEGHRRQLRLIQRLMSPKHHRRRGNGIEHGHHQPPESSWEDQPTCLAMLHQPAIEDAANRRSQTCPTCAIRRASRIRPAVPLASGRPARRLCAPSVESEF